MDDRRGPCRAEEILEHIAQTQLDEMKKGIVKVERALKTAQNEQELASNPRNTSEECIVHMMKASESVRRSKHTLGQLSKDTADHHLRDEIAYWKATMTTNPTEEKRSNLRIGQLENMRETLNSYKTKIQELSSRAHDISNWRQPAATSGYAPVSRIPTGYTSSPAPPTTRAQTGRLPPRKSIDDPSPTGR